MPAVHSKPGGALAGPTAAAAASPVVADGGGGDGGRRWTSGHWWVLSLAYLGYVANQSGLAAFDVAMAAARLDPGLGLDEAAIGRVFSLGALSQTATRDTSLCLLASSWCP